MINKVKRKTLSEKKKSSNMLEFLSSVKSGVFGVIEKSSLKYSRVKEQTEVKGIDTEEFFYSMS